MISRHFFKFSLSAIFFLLSLTFQVNANQDLEKKVKNLTLELRCMTCQNQSIYDSEAEFSNDIKNIVRSKFNEGKTDKEIKQFLVNRYGEYILFRPMINKKNMFLWSFPFILLGLGLFFIIFRVRKNNM